MNDFFPIKLKKPVNNIPKTDKALIYPWRTGRISEEWELKQRKALICNAAPTSMMLEANRRQAFNAKTIEVSNGTAPARQPLGRDARAARMGAEVLSYTSCGLMVS